MTTTQLASARAVDVIDRTFRIYRKNFITFIGLSLIATVIGIALNQWATSGYATARTYAELQRWQQNAAIALIVVGIVSVIIQLIFQALVVIFTSEHYLGRSPTLGEAFDLLRSRIRPLLVSILILGALIVGGGFLLGFISAACRGLPGIVFLFLVPPIAYAGLCMYFFLVPVIVLEEDGATGSIARAYRLGKARFWPVFGFFFGLWVISFVLELAVGALFGPGAATYATTGVLSPADLVSYAVAIFIWPIMTIGLTLMYFDTRIRTEGLDLAFAVLTKPDPRPSDVPVPFPTDGIFTGKDFLNTTVLTIGAIALFFVLGLSSALLLESLLGYGL